MGGAKIRVTPLDGNTLVRATATERSLRGGDAVSGYFGGFQIGGGT